ncbi:GspH/FimT family protein [Noviherbaspirillum aridicola]|uniref:GspH/FimT family protein n=1 Tax=Noviherbaspirillum aridicola TaxID=2849687 RepID=UPI001EE51892|nr:GspH/FimT family protein [Noviherbaspirillum aridicola]
MTAMMDAAQTESGGFTLVELMVVVAVVAILAGVAYPSMRDVVDARRVRVAAAEFMTAIQLARSEAIHRGERVDLAAIDNDWRNGWTVFVDRNRNRIADAGDDILLRQPAMSGLLQIESGLLDRSLHYLAYHPTGRSRTDASPQQPQFGTLRFRVGGQRRHIVLNMLGRPRLCTPAAGSDSC